MAVEPTRVEDLGVGLSFSVASEVAMAAPAVRDAVEKTLLAVGFTLNTPVAVGGADGGFRVTVGLNRKQRPPDPISWNYGEDGTEEIREG